MGETFLKIWIIIQKVFIQHTFGLSIVHSTDWIGHSIVIIRKIVETIVLLRR